MANIYHTYNYLMLLLAFTRRLPQPPRCCCHTLDLTPSVPSLLLMRQTPPVPPASPLLVQLLLPACYAVGGPACARSCTYLSTS